MQPDDLLAAWLRAMPLGDGTILQPDDRGVAYGTVDGAFSVAVTTNRERRLVGFVCFLAPAPEPSQGHLMHAILSMNLPLFAQRDATLGIDPQSGMLILARALPIEALDAERFAAGFAETIEMARAARAAVEETLRTGQPAADSAPGGDGPEAMWLKL